MDAIVTSELVDGLVTGAVVSGATAVTHAFVRPRVAMPVGGLLFALAGVVALAEWRTVPAALVLGLAGCAIATAVVARLRIPSWCAAIAVLPFAWLIAEHAGLPRVGWLRV